jgi:hypothetical protein
MLVVPQVPVNSFVFEAFEVERNPHAIRRRTAEVREQPEDRRLGRSGCIFFSHCFPPLKVIVALRGPY